MISGSFDGGYQISMAFCFSTGRPAKFRARAKIKGGGGGSKSLGFVSSRKPHTLSRAENIPFNEFC